MTPPEAAALAGKRPRVELLTATGAVAKVVCNPAPEDIVALQREAASIGGALRATRKGGSRQPATPAQRAANERTHARRQMGEWRT